MAQQLSQRDFIQAFCGRIARASPLYSGGRWESDEAALLFAAFEASLSDYFMPARSFQQRGDDWRTAASYLCKGARLHLLGIDEDYVREQWRTLVIRRGIA